MNGGVLKSLISGGDDIIFGHTLSRSKLREITKNGNELINPSLFATTRNNLDYTRKFGDIYLTGADDLIKPGGNISAYDRDVFSGTVPVRVGDQIIGRNGFRGQWDSQSVSDYMNMLDKYVDEGIAQGNIDAIAASVGKQLSSLDDIVSAASMARPISNFQRQSAESYARSRNYQDILNDFADYSGGASLRDRPSGYQEMMGAMQSGSSPYAEIKHRAPISISNFSRAYVPQYGEDEAIKYLKSMGIDVVPYSYGDNALKRVWV